MFRLDTVSCALTVLSTVLVGRKRWTGLVVAGANSVILCVIGVRTQQFGFIPANVFCIGVYAVSLRSWRRGQRAPRREPQSVTSRGADANLAYSVRRAFTGSIEAARWAGMMLAMSAQTLRVAMAAMRTTGSHPLT